LVQVPSESDPNSSAGDWALGVRKYLSQVFRTYPRF
jgi:hypothetical protein